jgi:oligosaccharyltransferase complex subunit epsilon
METINEIRNIDIYEQYESLKHIVTSFVGSYQQTTAWKIRLIDSYIVFSGLVFMIQLIYIVLNGLYPMNSLLAGLIVCIGSITLTVSLRLQVNPVTKVDGYSNEKAFAEYLFATLLLYIACINFLG